MLQSWFSVTATATRDHTSAPRCTLSRRRRQVRIPSRPGRVLDDRGGCGRIRAAHPARSRSTCRGPAPGRDRWGARAPCRAASGVSGGVRPGDARRPAVADEVPPHQPRPLELRSGGSPLGSEQLGVTAAAAPASPGWAPRVGRWNGSRLIVMSRKAWRSTQEKQHFRRKTDKQGGTDAISYLRREVTGGAVFTTESVCRFGADLRK